MDIFLPINCRQPIDVTVFGSNIYKWRHALALFWRSPTNKYVFKKYDMKNVSLFIIWNIKANNTKFSCSKQNLVYLIKNTILENAWHMMHDHAHYNVDYINENK